MAGLEVDLVYTWVQGQDPVHREKRNYWLQRYGLDPVVFNPDVRYVDADELRYSLRTAELFLPWVRRIFLVTDAQVPGWLNVDHPKVKVVDHTEIMPESDWLPTFNSNAIEAQLHNIPGLAEHFIACNDDHFFGQPCTVDDFFARLPARDGGGVAVKVMVSESDDDWITPMHLLADDRLAQLWMAGWNNVKAALELRHPWRRVRRVDIHQALSITRSGLRRTTEKFERDYRRTSALKFRSTAGMNFLALTRYAGLLNGSAVPGMLPNRVFRHESDLSSYARADLPTLFCINGGPEETGHGGGHRRPLERLFPRPSAFERTDGTDLQGVAL